MCVRRERERERERESLNSSENCFTKFFVAYLIIPDFDILDIHIHNTHTDITTSSTSFDSTEGI
jgi:hypothetical protein